MNIQDMNTKTQVIAVSDTSASKSFNPVQGKANAICYNGSSEDTFVTYGTEASAPTAVFPTTDAAQNGKVIPSGATMTFELPQGAKHIAAIQLVAGTGNLYIAVGEGI